MASPKYLNNDFVPVVAPWVTAQVVAVGDLLTLSAGNVIRADDVTWAAAVATPAAPTVADTAVSVGSGMANAATGVKISYQFPWGEGALSAAGTATPTLNAQLKVSGAPLVPPAPALWTNIYVETAAGSGTYKLWGVTYGSTTLVDSYGAGQVPAAANPGAAAVLSDATTITQYNCNLGFLGAAMQASPSDTSKARVYGNSKDNVIGVATGGVWEYDCASATFAVGDLVGPAKASGNALMGSKVAAVVHDTLAVGRVVEAGTSLTRVKVRLFSRKSPAAFQA